MPPAWAGPVIAGVLLLIACEDAGHSAGVIELEGPIMGTRYSVLVADPPADFEGEHLAAGIKATLDRINSLMSTYDPGSELSRFNAWAGKGWFEVSNETAEVVTWASSVSEITDGAFDVTVGPLVNLWGFGPEPDPESVPSPEMIAKELARVGYRKIEVRDSPPALRKARPDVYVDLSAIAKGYAVDRVAALLEGNGIGNYLVDVGGEVRVAGRNGAGEAWRLAVEHPRQARRTPYKVIQPGRGGIATSGNYRNFFELNGQRYAHTINPRTGWPVSHALLAVTVVADNTMQADAWATALMVLGPETGLALAEREGVAALLLSDDGGSIRENSTSVMKRLLSNPATPDEVTL